MVLLDEFIAYVLGNLSEIDWMDSPPDLSIAPCGGPFHMDLVDTNFMKFEPSWLLIDLYPSS